MRIIRVLCCSFVLLAAACAAQTIHLPSSKEILPPVPGSPRMLNSLPMTAARSLDHRYLALVNAGFGTVESNYDQSVAILDTATGRLTDFPDPRTALRAPQTMYSGIAFSPDGRHLCVSFDSLTAPDRVSIIQRAYTAGHHGVEPTATGDQPPFTADYRNEKNGLIYKENTRKSWGAKESARMDFTHEDRAPALELNIILWKDAMGNKPVPYLLLRPFAPRNGKAAKDDDDN